MTAPHRRTVAPGGGPGGGGDGGGGDGGGEAGGGGDGGEGTVPRPGRSGPCPVGCRPGSSDRLGSVAEHARETTTIAAPPEKVYAVLCDFERYPEWARDLKEARVVERGPDDRPVEVEFRAAAMGRSTRYRLRYSYDDDGRRLEWRLVHGDIMRRLDGAYELAPDGDGTRVTYELEVDLVVPLPGFVKRRAESRIINTALRELKARVESG